MHALSPYIMYVTEQMKVDSGKDVKSRMQEIAKQWNSLNPTQKKVLLIVSLQCLEVQKYETLSVKEKENRIQEFAKLSQEEQEKEVANAKETRQERAQRKERKERRQACFTCVCLILLKFSAVGRIWSSGTSSYWLESLCEGTV